MEILLLCHSCRVTLQMPLLAFVQPAGIIPKPQWQEIRKHTHARARTYTHTQRKRGRDRERKQDHILLTDTVDILIIVSSHLKT